MTPLGAAAPSIVHLGLGAFHRAHQAEYLQRLIDRGDRRWRLRSGNLRNDGAALEAALSLQRGAYTLETVSPDGERRYQRITAIEEVLRWDPSLAAVLAAGADPATRIVSFTVTEAGYGLDGDSVLDLESADVRSDLDAARLGRPGRTIYGALVAILRRRIADGAGPVTLLCCDNLRHNGTRSRAALLRFIGALGDTALLDWVAAHTASPNAMVDRITPRPDAGIGARVKAATGVDDGAAVMAESFIQWVIEDTFAAERPAWEGVGVEMVGSVAPYEEAKIRLLNASHSCLAWAGVLAGHAFVHESSRDPQIRRFAHDYVSDDAIPALGASPIDLAAYRDTVLERFGNAAIPDTLERVAADSVSKLAGFVAPTVRQRLAQGGSIDAVAMLPALFLAFAQRWLRGQLGIDYVDRAEDLALVRRLCAAADPVAALASEQRVWGSAAGDERFAAALRRARERVAAFEASRERARPRP